MSLIPPPRPPTDANDGGPRPFSYAAARVLVVEDDPDTRALLEATLEDAGLRVELAADGESALRLAAHHPPDAVVLDLMLPGLTGWEVAGRLSAVTGQPVPIVIVSAAPASVFRLPPSVACVIPKPFSPEAVASAVRSVVAAHAMRPTHATDLHTTRAAEPPQTAALTYRAA